jgi:choline dehydrogenase-like flavoprotein
MRYELTEEVVCVVGSGASGSAVARELSQAGVRTVIFESGKALDRSKIPTDRDDWELKRGSFFESGNDGILSESSEGFKLKSLKVVGGSTMHYEGFSPRMHADDWKRKSQFDVGADWPLKYADIEPLYEQVEQFLGVSGNNDNLFGPKRGPYSMPAVPMSASVRAMARAAAKAGLHPSHAPLAILSKPASGLRKGCNSCGTCWEGCFVGAISNAAQTYLPAAERNGAELRQGSTVTQVVLRKGSSTVDFVEFLDAQANLHRQKARAVVLCGNAIESARLLLLSSQSGFPEGLANSSGLVGRNFMGHLLVSGSGVLRDRVNGYAGPNVNGMLQDFYRSDAKRNFIGGYTVVLRNGQLGPYTSYVQWFKKSALFGRELYEQMDARFGHTVEIAAFGEQLPFVENKVILDSAKKDRHGLALAKVQNTLSENDRKLMGHAASTLKTILEAAQASEIRVHESPQVLGTHLMGTTRMGIDPTTSVTDSYGQTHDVANLFVADGGLFPTSTPANPTLTIQVLATRAASRLLKRMKQREI